MAKRNISTSYSEERSRAQSIVEELKARYDLEEDELKKLKELAKEADREAVLSKYALEKELQKKRHEKEVENLKAEGKIIEAFWESAFGTLDATNKTFKSISSSLTSAIDKSLESYISRQQSMVAHLQGSNTDLQNITNTLQSTLSTSRIVRQEKVYENLSKLVNSGIVYNVEQRAFLETLARDIDSVFSATNGSLTRLIRIQSQDLSSNRLAIEYSLQTFLNQNYQTSEYIKTSFNNVSESLLSAQIALQNSTEAIRLESAVQTQLGSMYSAGLSQNTVEGLAKAINSLGSGDISGLGSGGISNLLIMAAARAGMDYGQLLNQGVTGQQATTLLQNVTSYLAEMGQNQSNVVKAELGKVFGVDITDIIASQKVGTVNGSVSADIENLFNDYGNFITTGTGIKNIMANMMYSFGTNMARNEMQLMSYEITNLISKSGIGDILFQTGDALKSSEGRGLLSKVLGSIGNTGASILQLAGIAANAAPLLPILTSFFGKDGTFSDIFSSIRAQSQGVSGLFEALASGDSSKLNIRMSDAGVSGSAYIATGGTSDLLNSSMNSLNELTSNVVTVSNEDTITWEDNVATITSDVSSILEILNTYMQSISDNLDIISNATTFNTVNYSTAGHSL